MNIFKDTLTLAEESEPGTAFAFVVLAILLFGFILAMRSIFKK